MEKHELPPNEDERLLLEDIVWDAINWLVKHDMLDEESAEQQMYEWFHNEDI